MPNGVGELKIEIGKFKGNKANINYFFIYFIKNANNLFIIIKAISMKGNVLKELWNI